MRFNLVNHNQIHVDYNDTHQTRDVYAQSIEEHFPVQVSDLVQNRHRDDE